MTRRRDAGPGLDGVLVVAKPPGPTSHDVVGLVRRLSGTKRVGHGGTLDPFASGVLPLFLGRATRVVEYHLSDRKSYRATVCFGASSTTDDLDGELTPSDGAAPTRESVEAALPSFRGRITQTPPPYSAIKVGGRRAYALARAGQPVELKPREVEIARIEIVDWDVTDPDRPIAVVEVDCSAGTYVRALARDLGAAVGNAAYLGALARTASGPFRIESAVPLDAIRAAAGAGDGRLSALLLPVDAGLDEVPSVALPPDDVASFARGQHVRVRGGIPHADGTVVRVSDPDGGLIGMARVAGGRLAPDKVLVQAPGATPPVGHTVARVAPAGPVVVPGVEALEVGHGPLFACVGVFDGLHLGHQYLLAELRANADRLGARPAVITFDSHPDEVLVGAAPPLLLHPRERLRLLGERGIEVVVVQHFDAALRTTPYDAFVGAITSRTQLAGLLMTPESAFGHERRGTPDALADLGRRAEPPFEVVVVPAHELEGRPVSSSEIRRLVQSGDLAGAERLLGRPYSVLGTVDAEDPARVRFTLPVALPPPGRHAATVEARAAGVVEPTPASAVVASGDGGVVFEGIDLPAGDVRITFVAP